MGKYLWIVVGVVVLVAIYFMGGDWTGKNTGDEAASLSPSPSSKTVAKTVAKTSPAPTSTKSYTELVKEYEGRRIQFDNNCLITPLRSEGLTYKNGTSVMLDNRSASARTISVGEAKYSLASYGYKIVTLSGSNLPRELLLNCDSSGTVGKILLQAQILQ